MRNTSSYSCLFSMKIPRAAVLFTIVLLLADKSDGKERSKSGEPILHDIYTLDHFIELVEKIEQHPKTNMDVATVANYIRGLMGNDDQELWKVLIPGSYAPLPDGVLSLKEKNVLINMVKHRYDGPIEYGVVRTPHNDTIAIGHVINGICAGAVRDKDLSLVDWNEDAEDPIDNLFAATISGTLSLTGLEMKNDPTRVLFGPGGSWGPNSLCPELYTRSSAVVSNASDAQILGDVDGFLLGYNLKEWKAKGVRLGQLLRMYYSGGVCYDRSFVDCYRSTNVKSLINSNFLLAQIIVFAFSYHDKHQAIYPNVKKRDIITIARDTNKGFFTYIERISKNTLCEDTFKSEGCELPANIVFVMDESGSIRPQNYLKEKTFVKIIIRNFDVSPYQTRVAVVEYSDNPRLSIALHDYGSKTRLMCAIDRFDYKTGGTHTGKALKMVNDQILKKAQDKTRLNKYVGERLIPQIVILLTDGKSNDPDPNSLRREVNRIKKDIQGLTVIAVGIGGYNQKELELIATNPSNNVFEATDFEGLIRLVTSIQNRTCSTPVELDIDFHNGANETVVSAFVSPSRPRYFVLPSKLFKGIKNLYLEVTPIYGTVAIYASRTFETPGPLNHTYKIDPLNAQEQMILYIPDPCQDYINTTCPDVYLAIFGDSSTLSCSERYCNLPNQIKFTIKKGVKPVFGFADTLSQKASFLVLSCLVLQALLSHYHLL